MRQGIEAARKGDKATAQKLLRQVVESDHDNEIAWMWLASTIDNLQERKQALEQALRINPENTRAQDALTQLNTILGVSAPPRRAAGNRGPAASLPADLRPQQGGGLRTVLAIFAAIGALGILVVIIFSIVNSRTPAPPNSATIAAQQVLLNQTLAPTVTIDPDTYTATPFYGVIVTPRNLVDLPPTFTPTFTPTAEPTPSCPSFVRISANRNAISVSGFCRPVSTLASLMGEASGRKDSDSPIHSMRSVVARPAARGLARIIVTRL